MYLSLFTAAIAVLLVSITIVKIKEPRIDVLSWDEAYSKASLLVNKMSLEQKSSIATGIGWAQGLCAGNTHAIYQPDFPSLCLQDSPVGVRSSHHVTSGVAGINAAASFDRKAIYERGAYIGKEFRNKGIHVHLGPAINFMRSPQGGRGWESGGEDPFLNGILAAETVLGVQDQGVIAAAKHYLLNEQELNRMTSSSDIDRRTLHEIYLWPFARAVEAGLGSVMCSYNRVNGVFGCENDYLLNTVLKGELGFKGFVQSDWGATKSTVDSANNGLDMTMPGGTTFDSLDSYFGKNLSDAVEDKKVPESRVIDIAMRIVATWYRLGQDKKFPSVKINNLDMDSAPVVHVQEDHHTLVRDMGAASAVLLTNSGILPFKKSIRSVAFIGNDAALHPDGINSCEWNACSIGTLAHGWGSGTATFPYLIDPITGIKNALGKGVDYRQSLDDWDLDAAAKTAKDVDVALVFASSNSGEELAAVEDNNGDRKNLSLWNNGDNLIRSVADANPNTVVVIHSVGPVLMPWIDHPNIKAIVWPGLPGQESGNSLADVLTGQVNPSGRLPYTIAKEISDYNTDIDPSDNIVYREKLLVGYKWFDSQQIEPQFPFGHGLSYTQFVYSDLTISKSESKVSASVSIHNNGALDGAEIVQAYLGFPEDAGEPPKVLRGFEKVFIKKGETEPVQFVLGKTELSIWSIESDAWVVPSGQFTLYIGASSRDIRQSIAFTL